MAPRVVLGGLVALLCVARSFAHDWDWGKCPRVSPMADMDLERFLGDWFVIEQFDTDSSCVKFAYSRVSSSRLRVTKTRQLAPLGPLRHNSYGGTLDVPNAGSEGKLRVQWPLNVAGKGDYIIFDTDYTTYAGLYDCQRLTGLMHRKNAAILSRTPELAASVVDQLKRSLRSAGVPTKHFDKVSHANCPAVKAGEPVVSLDSDTLPEVVAEAGDALEDAVNWVFNGVRNLTDTVVEGVSSPDLPSGVDTARGPSKRLDPEVTVDTSFSGPRSTAPREQTTKDLPSSTLPSTPLMATPTTADSTTRSESLPTTMTTPAPRTTLPTTTTPTTTTPTTTTTTYIPPNYPESVDMDPSENEIEPVRDIVRTVVDIEI